MSRHHSGRDLQATDQVTMDGKAPLQLGGPTGEVAGEAASHEVALKPLEAPVKIGQNKLSSLPEWFQRLEQQGCTVCIER